MINWITLLTTDSQPVRINLLHITHFHPNAMNSDRTDIEFVGGKRITVSEGYPVVRGKINRAEGIIPSAEVK